MDEHFLRLGNYVIDKKKKIVVQIVYILDDLTRGLFALYVVYDDETKEYYIADADRFISYSKDTYQEIVSNEK